MLRVVSDKAAIKRYAALFNKKFKSFVDEEIKVRLGHQGAGFPAKVAWSKKLGIWKFSKTVKEVRYWNAFGVERPGGHHVLSIAAEINFPWKEIDRKIGGAFAEDHWGNVFVIHRGKIGGGKKGVGKSLFEEQYRGVWSHMEDGDSISPVAIIGELKSEHFALQAAQFVKKIEKLKSAASSVQMEINFSEITFREELVGGTSCLPEDEIAFACEHDVVVAELASALGRMNIRSGNDAQSDLFVYDAAENRISHFFEVVTSAAEKNVMAAVGRLMLMRADGAHLQPVLVLPEEKTKMYAEPLHRVHIAVVGFHWQQDKAVFSGLDKIKPDSRF